MVGVEDLTLSVEPGEIYGFLGSNGAGKTTTIRMLMNLLYPTCGKARIFGKDSVKHHLEICKQIGYIPGSVRPHIHMTGDAFLGYTGKLSNATDHRYRQHLLDTLAFSAKDLKRKIKEYSTGMARKIALVQTFQHRPRLVIMDEPTEGLDPVMQHAFYQLLKEYRDEGGTVFLSSHNLGEVEKICDRAAIIRNGSLVAVEKIIDLKNKTARTIHVRFKEPVTEELLHSTAWDIVEIKGVSLTAKINGELDPIIKLLSTFDISDMSLPDAGLQDVFLGYYREEGEVIT